MKYKDVKSLGNSEVVPFKPGESWHQRHHRRLNVNLEHANEIKSWCNANGWTFEIKNDGHHWIFRKKGVLVEWWASSAKLVKNKAWSKGIHCHDYLKVIEVLSKG